MNTLSEYDCGEALSSTRINADTLDSITDETDDPNATHGSPQGWSEAVVAQEASCKARYGHRRSLRVHLDTVHSLPSSWDPIVGNKAPSFTEDKEMRNGGMLTRAYRKGERQCDPRAVSYTHL